MCMGESLGVLAPLLGHFLGFHHTCLDVSPALDGAVFGSGGGTCVGGVSYRRADCWFVGRVGMPWNPGLSQPRPVPLRHQDSSPGVSLEGSCEGRGSPLHQGSA